MSQQLVKHLLITLWLGCSVTVYSQTENNFFSKLPHMPLVAVSVQEKSVEPKFYVYVFMSPECPLCQSYIPILNALKTTYQKDVKIIGIIPGKAYSKNDISKFEAAYNVNFSLFIDPQKKLTKYVAATVTPEVMVFTRNYERIYSGAIDDKMQKIGEKKLLATTFYLKNALNEQLKGAHVTIPKTKATGCFINDY